MSDIKLTSQSVLRGYVVNAIGAILGLKQYMGRPAEVIMQIIFSYYQDRPNGDVNHLKAAISLQPLHLLGIHEAKTVHQLDLLAEVQPVIKKLHLAKSMVTRWNQRGEKLPNSRETTVAKCYFSAFRFTEWDRKDQRMAERMLMMILADFSDKDTEPLINTLHDLAQNWGAIGQALLYILLRIVINHMATTFLNKGFYVPPRKNTRKRRCPADAELREKKVKKPAKLKVVRTNAFTDESVLFSLAVPYGRTPKVLVWHIHKNTLLFDLSTALSTLKKQLPQETPLLRVRGHNDKHLSLSVFLSLIQASINQSVEAKTPAFIGEIIYYLFETQMIPHLRNDGKFEAVTVLLSSSAHRRELDNRCREEISHLKKYYEPIVVKPTKGDDNSEYAIINGKLLGVENKKEAIRKRVAEWETSNPLVHLLHSLGWVRYSLIPSESIAWCSLKELFHGNALLFLFYLIEPFRRRIEKLGDELVHHMECNDDALHNWTPGQTSSDDETKVKFLRLESFDLNSSVALYTLLGVLKDKLEALYRFGKSSMEYAFDYCRTTMVPDFVKEFTRWAPRICTYMNELKEPCPKQLTDLIEQPTGCAKLSWHPSRPANPLGVFFFLVEKRVAQFPAYCDRIEAEWKRATELLDRVRHEIPHKEPLVNQGHLITAMAFVLSKALWPKNQTVNRDLWYAALLQSRDTDTKAMQYEQIRVGEVYEKCCKGVETPGEQQTFDKKAHTLLEFIQRRAASSSSTPEAKCPSLERLLAPIVARQIDVYKLALGVLFDTKRDDYGEFCAQLLFTIAVKCKQHSLYHWVKDAMRLVALRVLVEPNMDVLYATASKDVKSKCKRFFQQREEKKDTFIDLT